MRKYMNENLLKLINEKQMTSILNKTKWKEICDYFSNENTFSPLVRGKLLTNGEMSGFAEVWWTEVFGCCELIEWMEFSKYKYEHRGNLLPKKEMDVTVEVKEALDDIGVAYTDEERVFKVWGYINNESRPSHV